MKKVIVVLMLYMTLFQAGVNSQVTQEWVATYSGTGSGYNFPKKSAVDKLGNFIVAGNSDSTNGYDYIVLKYSPGGELLWKQRYNGKGNDYDYLTSMVLDDSGNIFVTGVSWEGNSSGQYNWVTIKYNPAGDTLWIRSFDWETHRQDECYGMALDKNNNLFITGFCQVSSFLYETAMVTIKYNRNGDFQWAKSYFPPLPLRSNWGYSVVTDDSGNAYASGYGAVPTGNEIVTIKYDPNGVEKWIKNYPTYYGDYLRPTLSGIDNENNIIVVGYNYTDKTDYDFVTLKYTGNGNLLWSRLFDRGYDDYANSLFIDNSSNILICGSTVDSTLNDYLVLKYSSNGDTLLIKIIRGSQVGTDIAHSISSDNLENIYVTGYSQPFGGAYYYLTVKMDSSGKILWSKYYHNMYDDFSYNLCLDKYNNVYISGSSGTAGGNSSVVTLKYSQFTGIENNFNENLINFPLRNYPNPFNISTLIEYQIPRSSYIKLIVYDITGKKIETLVNRFIEKGNYRLNFSGEKYSSGLYLYSLIVNGEIVNTKRMLIIK